MTVSAYITQAVVTCHKNISRERQREREVKCVCLVLQAVAHFEMSLEAVAHFEMRV